MPRYDYQCDRDHVTEAVGGFDSVFITCNCGLPAMRVAVYRDQFIHAETGPKGGRKNDVPRDEKDLRKPYREFREASQEVEYAYSKTDDPNVKAPDLYKAGVQKAKKRGVKVRA